MHNSNAYALVVPSNGIREFASLYLKLCTLKETAQMTGINPQQKREPVRIQIVSGPTADQLRPLVNNIIPLDERRTSTFTFGIQLPNIFGVSQIVVQLERVQLEDGSGNSFNLFGHVIEPRLKLRGSLAPSSFFKAYYYASSISTRGHFFFE